MTEHAHADLTAQQIRDHAYPYLIAASALSTADHARTTYARRHGEDLVELLVHRDHCGLRRLTDDDVAKVGAADLYALARERLRMIPTGKAEVERPDHGEFQVLRGASELTASKLVLLPEVLRPALGPALKTPAGLLVSVPTRRQLAFAPVAGDIPAVLVYLARYTVITHEDSRDALSPSTYWWHGGTLTPIVTVDGRRDPEFRFPPAFLDAVAFSPLENLG
jgi:hypothetical protein